MKEIVNEINESPTILRLLEVGAGVPIANEFFNYSGASKTIYSTESYYSREAFDRMFGGSKNRAVSAERLKDINDNNTIQNDINSGLYNTVLSTSFQVGDETNKTSTHGWISINIEGKNIRYFHISLHYPNSRIEHIKNIGEIGILLLHANNASVPENCFVDIVLDENLQPLHHETLEFLSKCEDMMSVFTTNGIDRLESVTRDIETLIVYKGSFNPPSIGHMKLMTNTLDLYENKKRGIFCLSYNTFQKGVQSVDSFLERVEYLNILGWDVLVSTKPLFKDTYDFIRLKYNAKIVFPQGIDTLNRMSQDYLYPKLDNQNIQYFRMENFISDFQNVDFIVYVRTGEEIISIVKDELVSNNKIKMVYDTTHADISSTIIRNLIKSGEYEKVKLLVPNEIYNDLIKNNTK